jgi:hypothetical protein
MPRGRVEWYVLPVIELTEDHHQGADAAGRRSRFWAGAQQRLAPGPRPGCVRRRSLLADLEQVAYRHPEGIGETGDHGGRRYGAATGVGADRVHAPLHVQSDGFYRSLGIPQSLPEALG